MPLPAGVHRPALQIAAVVARHRCVASRRARVPFRLDRACAAGHRGGARYGARAFHARRQFRQPRRIRRPDVLPIAQLASVFGVGGILFVVHALQLRARARHSPRAAERVAARTAYSAVVALFVGTAVVRRVATADAVSRGKEVTFGIVVDRRLHRRPAWARNRIEVWAQYDAQVAALAAGGARSCCCRRRSTCCRPAGRAVPAGAARRSRARQQGVARRRARRRARGRTPQRGLVVSDRTASSRPTTSSTTWRRPSASSLPGDEYPDERDRRHPTTASRSARTCTSRVWDEDSVRATRP